MLELDFYSRSSIPGRLAETNRLPGMTRLAMNSGYLSKFWLVVVLQLRYWFHFDWSRTNSRLRFDLDSCLKLKENC